MYQQFVENLVVCKSLKIGIILPLFKGKGAKANNKDNYRGITLFGHRTRKNSCSLYVQSLCK